MRENVQAEVHAELEEAEERVRELRRRLGKEPGDAVEGV